MPNGEGGIMGMFANIGGEQVKLDKLLVAAAATGAGVSFPVSDSLELDRQRVLMTATMLPNLRIEGDPEACAELRDKALQHKDRLVGWLETARTGDTIVFF
jgi:hypothetical protein